MKAKFAGGDSVVVDMSQPVRLDQLKTVLPIRARASGGCSDTHNHRNRVNTTLTRVAFTVVALLATACGADAGNSMDAANNNATSQQPQTSEAIAANQVDDIATPSTTSPSTTSPSLTSPNTTNTSRQRNTTGRPGENVKWETPLAEGIDFGTVTVPLNYHQPDSGELEIALLVSRARNPSERIGYLFVNPGGPGGSGVEMASAAAAGYGFDPELVERFDIVGFDPRGVGYSEPAFQCGEPGEQLELLNKIELPYDTAEKVALGEEAAQLCVESMGAAAGLLHSEFVARDMDEIRNALGAEQISYFGVSYGSTLGVWNATLFPQRVRAMVLDGADNPVDDVSSQEARIANAIEENAQLEARLTDALNACNNPSCPIFNDGDPQGYLTANAHRLAEVAQATNGNPLSGVLGLILTIYSEQTWPDLWEGLAALVERNDPSMFAAYASLYFEEDFGGTTFTEHVNCLDSWVLYPQIDRETRLGDQVAGDAAFAAQLPLLSLLEPNAASTCYFYDTFGTPTFTEPLDGADVPILVIGNLSDPATPFSESQELVEETLSNGHLLTVDHFAHVAYPDNECATEAVHAVLIAGEPPSSFAGDCVGN